MSTFSEELTAARKAKHLTQEQLAEAVKTSRSAVSHWESGRNEPDLETLRQLSVVLGCTFSVQNVPQEKAPQQINADTPMTMQAAPAEKKKLKWIIPLAAAAALVVLAVCLAVPMLNHQTQTAKASAENSTEQTAAVPQRENTVEWFSSTVQPQDGKPFVSVYFDESPLLVIRNEDFPEGLGWLYTVFMEETNGFSFDIANLDIVLFTDRGDAFVDSYSADVINDWFGGHHDIAANSQLSFGGGMPVQDLCGVGVSLTGTDVSGTELEFHGYLPLSKEIRD